MTQHLHTDARHAALATRWTYHTRRDRTVYLWLELPERETWEVSSNGRAWQVAKREPWPEGGYRLTRPPAALAGDYRTPADAMRAVEAALGAEAGL